MGRQFWRFIEKKQKVDLGEKMIIPENTHDYIITKRRYLHQYPELSGQEIETAKFLKEELDRLGLDYEEIGETGLLVSLTNGNGPTILLRADMDALPINEMTKVHFQSKKRDVMHACGHDAHMAMLLGGLKILLANQEKWQGRVVALFQPAEETGERIGEILEHPIFDEVEWCLAIHVMPDVRAGYLSVDAGERMAGLDDFDIHLTGSGGHGALPHLGQDCLLCGTTIVNQLQKIVARDISPIDSAVVTVGQFEAGGQRNVLASHCLIKGNTRYFKEEVGVIIRQNLMKTVEQITSLYGVRGRVDFIDQLPPLYNDKQACQLAKQAIERYIGVQWLVQKEKMMASEDFSNILNRIPGLMAFLGVGFSNQQNPPLHSNCFDIDETGLLNGSKLLAGYVMVATKG